MNDAYRKDARLKAGFKIVMEKIGHIFWLKSMQIKDIFNGKFHRVQGV